MSDNRRRWNLLYFKCLTTEEGGIYYILNVQNQDLQVQKNMNGNKQVKSKERKTVNIKSHSKTGRKNCYLKW
jgi:hypothetical protein